MLTKFKLFEAKQVGLLYHWTSLRSLINILENDEMISRQLKCLRNHTEDTTAWGDYISFSRNKKLNYHKKSVLIIFDGNKLSNKYKFEHHLFMEDPQFKEEAEERIKISKITNIKKYILGIQIKKWELDLNPEIDYFQSLIPNVKIEIIE